MLHYPRNRHVTITTHVAYPTTAAGVTPAWMHQVCRKGCEDHNLRLEEGSLSRWFNVPRPNIINYTQLLHEGKAIYIGAVMREDLVASRLNHHRTDAFGVQVSASVSIALINANPSTKILDVDKEAVISAASPLPAAALTNIDGNFGKGCQPGTCAVGSAVYMMIPLRDVQDRDVYPVPAGGIRDITALNLRANGQGAFTLKTDAYSTSTDAHTLGTSVRHQPGYVEKRKQTPCLGCGKMKHLKSNPCPLFAAKRRKKNP